MKEGIFENLMRRMVEASPITFKQIIVKCLIQNSFLKHGSPKWMS